MSLQSDIRAAVEAAPNFRLTDPRGPSLSFADGKPSVIVRYSGHDIRPKGLVEATDVLVITGALLSKDPYVLDGKAVADWVGELITIIYEEGGVAFPEERNVTALHAYTVGDEADGRQFVGALIRVIGA